MTTTVCTRTRRSAFADTKTTAASPPRDDDSQPWAHRRHGSPDHAGSDDTFSSWSSNSSSPHTPPPSRSPPRCSSTLTTCEPSVAISRTEPDFSFTTQPSAHQRSSRSGTSSAPRGKLVVKLIEARSLSAPSRSSRPYVVVTYDQNEFVSREPIDELAGDLVGVAKPRPAEAPAAGKPTRLPPPAAQDGTAGNGGASKEPMAVPIVATPSTTSDGPGGGSYMSPGAAKSPSSGLGRSLEEYRNGAMSSGTSNEAPQPSESSEDKPERPSLAPVDTNPRNGNGGWQASDDPTTPTSAPANGGQLGASDDSMAYNPTWKHEVTL